ncbi:MAG: hypothetical protein V3W31_05825, partial [Thermodesulfobacteriota bacterium]
MVEPYYKQRLALMDGLLEPDNDMASGQPWTLDPKKQRFKLGETLAELKVPYHLGSDDEAVIKKAVVALVTLFKVRYDAEQVEGEGYETPPEFSLEIRQELKDKTYKTEALMPDSIEREVAVEILRTTPFVDGAMLSIWLGPDGYGKEFIQWVSDMVEKTLKEEIKVDGEERTSYLFFLAMMCVIRKWKGKVEKGLRIRGLAYEKLDVAVSYALCMAVSAAVRGVFSRLKEARALCYSVSSEAVFRSALVPRAFLSIPSGALLGSFNPYGINRETFEALSEHAPELTETTGSVEDLISVSLSGAKKVLRVVKDQHRVTALRDRILDYLIKFDMAGVDAHHMLYDISMDDRLIGGLFDDPKAAEKLTAALDGVREKFSRDLQRCEAIEEILSVISPSKKGVLGWLGGGKKEDDPTRVVVERFVAARFDEHVDKFAGHMRVYMVDRRKEFDNNTLI